MQELTTEQVEMTKARDKKCRRKAQVWFGLQSMQFGSIIYKGIYIPKKAPQYLQSQILRSVAVGRGEAAAHPLSEPVHC